MCEVSFTNWNCLGGKEEVAFTGCIPQHSHIASSLNDFNGPEKPRLLNGNTFSKEDTYYRETEKQLSLSISPHVFP